MTEETRISPETEAPQTECEEGNPQEQEAGEELLRLCEIAAQMALQKAMEWSGKACPEEDPQARLARELMRQEEEMRLETPEFDVEEMMRTSPAFRALVLAGEPVSRALDYVDPGRGMRAAEKEVVRRIQKRNLRPQTISMGNRPMADVSIEDRLDEDEMRRIDHQLKRGRKVYL